MASQISVAIIKTNELLDILKKFEIEKISLEIEMKAMRDALTATVASNKDENEKMKMYFENKTVKLEEQLKEAREALEIKEAEAREDSEARDDLKMREETFAREAETGGGGSMGDVGGFTDKIFSGSEDLKTIWRALDSDNPKLLDDAIFDFVQTPKPSLNPKTIFFGLVLTGNLKNKISNFGDDDFFSLPRTRKFFLSEKIEKHSSSTKKSPASSSSSSSSSSGGGGGGGGGGGSSSSGGGGGGGEKEEPQRGASWAAAEEERKEREAISDGDCVTGEKEPQRGASWCGYVARGGGDEGGKDEDSEVWGGDEGEDECLCAQWQGASCGPFSLSCPSKTSRKRRRSLSELSPPFPPPTAAFAPLPAAPPAASPAALPPSSQPAEPPAEPPAPPPAASPSAPPSALPSPPPAASPPLLPQQHAQHALVQCPVCFKQVNLVNGKPDGRHMRFHK